MAVTAAAESTEEYEFPLSHQQRRLWFLAQAEPESGAYHLSAAMRLCGDLDVAALARAVRDLLARHEALRTRYVRDRPSQLVSTAVTACLTVIDAAGGVEPTAAASALVARPFDLWSAPPVRACLLRLRPGEHVLVLVVHHIAADGVSVGLLLADLADAYRGRARPEPELQYGDYVLWQQERTEESLEYWSAALAGAPPALHLPTDHPRGARPAAGARARRRLDPLLTRAVERLAESHGVTLFMAVLAGYALVLSRMAGQHDVVIGTPSAGRDRPELRGVVGCFIDLLPVRVDLRGVTDVAGLLRRVRDAVLGALAHADTPFDRIVARLDPPRDPSRTPLFQAMLSFDGASLPDLELPGVTVAELPLDAAGARYELTVDVERADDTLVCWLEYRADLFTPATAELVLARLERALAGLVSQSTVEAIDVVGPPERDLLHRMGTGPAAAPPTRVPEAIAARWVGRDGEVALVDAATGVTTTFGELRADAATVTGRLAAAGVGRGDLVGVLLPRDPRLVAALLGVWGAGAAYLPLDPRWPEERLRYLAADAGVRLVLTTTSLVAALDLPQVRWLCLDEAGPAAAVPGSTSPDDVAYVLYTSGSTGRPKGVAVGHAGVTNLLRSVASRPGLRPADRWLAVTTLSFDISVLELFGPLLAGGVVVLASAEQGTDPDLLGEAIDRFAPTVVQATPTMWRMLLTAGWRGAPLRVLTGGEALPPDLAAALLAQGHEVWNLYGPTETTIWSTLGPIEEADSVHMGQPVHGTVVRLLDRRGRLAPAGAVAEVYLGGIGVAHGYLGRRALTAGRFVPDPYTRGERLYRTGDLGRWRSDGMLTFHGRVDNQHKVRGLRMDVGEVEAVLTSHPAVRAAAAAVHQAGHDATIVAYVVGSVDAAELLAHARRHLPAGMVPNHFVAVAQLPRTPNGKLDRAALAPPPIAPPRAPAPEPTDDLARDVLGCFRRVLARPELPLDADFFAYGGTSMLAVDLLAELERAVGARPPLRDLLRDPTAAGVVALLRPPAQPLHVARVRPDVWAPAAVLVAGATSLLGAALVEHLLGIGVRVVCAVPASDEDEARRALVAASARFGVELSGVEVIAVEPGRPHLAAQVGAVYHVAGQPPAVGLEAVIRLAATGDGRAVHHVAPLRPALAVDGVLAERPSTDPDEALVLEAAIAGLPVTIIRVAAVGPRRWGGRADGLLGLLLDAVEATSLVPDVPELTVPGLTADQAAGALVALTRNAAADGHVLHLLDPAPRRLRDLVAAGSGLTVAPVAAWVEQVARVCGTEAAARLTELVHSGPSHSGPSSVTIASGGVDAVLGHRLVLEPAPADYPSQLMLREGGT